jgi:hypothetical protein
VLRFLLGYAAFYLYFCIKPDDGPPGAKTCSTVNGILLHNKYSCFLRQLHQLINFTFRAEVTCTVRSWVCQFGAQTFNSYRCLIKLHRPPIINACCGIRSNGNSLLLWLSGVAEKFQPSPSCRNKCGALHYPPLLVSIPPLLLVPTDLSM